MSSVHLRAGHVQPVWAGHPWVFAQAIARVDGAPGPGDEVNVLDPKDHFLGRGYWSPDSAIPVRILSRRQDTHLDEAWLGRRLDAAHALRTEILGLPGGLTTGYRLVHAEGDGLAGLIVDVFGDVAAVQLLSVGMKRREEVIYGHVARVTGARTVLEVPSHAAQRAEGFETATRIVRGPDVPELHFRERGFEYRIPLSVAQKTGFYFDQRENRSLVERLAKGRRVLDAFAYVGAFSLAAARGGAKEVVAVERAAPAVATAGVHVHDNGFDGRIHVERADLKRYLPEAHRARARYDMVLVDPPKLIPTTRHLEAGRRAYRKLNANALSVVSKDGLLITCSCSAALSETDFLRTVALAAKDAGRETTVLFRGHQAPDHPAPPAFPEGRYLKALVLGVR